MIKTDTILIGLAGKIQSGKSTLAEALHVHFGFEQLAFAAPLKQALNTLFGWNMSNWDDHHWKEAEIPGLGKSPRQLAQTLGTEWGREQVRQDFWTWLIEHNPKFLHPRVVISDVRFPNEVEFVKKHHGKVVYIERSMDTDSPVTSHISEAYNIKEQADYIILNNLAKLDLFMNMRKILQGIDNEHFK